MAGGSDPTPSSMVGVGPMEVRITWVERNESDAPLSGLKKYR